MTALNIGHDMMNYLLTHGAKNHSCYMYPICFESRNKLDTCSGYD